MEEHRLSRLLERSKESIHLDTERILLSYYQNIHQWGRILKNLSQEF